jgi:thiol-disulfide isomerase/thioredoxin
MRTYVSNFRGVTKGGWILLIGLIFVLGGCGKAPPPSEELRTGKPSVEPRFLDDVDLALERAAEIKQPILLEFTGSDWCPPCMKMHREVLATPEFKEFSEREILYVVLQFLRYQPQPAALREANERAAARYRVNGFPTYILLDSSGKELARHVGFMPGGPQAMIRWIQRKTSR